MLLAVKIAVARTVNKIGGKCPDGSFKSKKDCINEGGANGGSCNRRCPECDEESGDCSFTTLGCDVVNGISTVKCGDPCPMGETIPECEEQCGEEECEYSCWDCVDEPFDFEDKTGGFEICKEITVVDECEQTTEDVCDGAFLDSSEYACLTGGCGDSGLTNDTGYNSSQKDRVYSMTYVDEVFERNHSNKTYKLANAEFLPINRGTLPASLFKTTVHTSVRAVYDLNNRGMLFSDIPYSDLEDEDIEKSLQP